MNDTQEVKPLVKIIHGQAKTMYVSSKGMSYGIFCWNTNGDLFLNSDWGFYGYAWRSYGDSFDEFLKNVNAEYVVGKFEINYITTNRNKKIPPTWRTALVLLVQAFVDELKTETI